MGVIWGLLRSSGVMWGDMVVIWCVCYFLTPVALNADRVYLVEPMNTYRGLSCPFFVVSRVLRVLHVTLLCVIQNNDSSVQHSDVVCVYVYIRICS